MSTRSRVVLVHRATEWDELIARHGTRGQVAFFLSSRGQDLEAVEARHRADQDALATVLAAIPADWGHGIVERADLPRFLFGADDIVAVVGQDGLVANVARYLDGQLLIGFNPEPSRNPGVLVRHRPDDAAKLFASRPATAELTMVEAVADDGQRLLSLNEVYIGQPTHQTARYRLQAPGGQPERQASSGVIVATGTGATGWCRSVAQAYHSRIRLPAPHDPRLAWFVREAWPSPATGTEFTEGVLEQNALILTAESDRLVVFGDGMEDDRLALTWGQTVRVAVASERLRLAI